MTSAMWVWSWKSTDHLLACIIMINWNAQTLLPTYPLQGVYDMHDHDKLMEHCLSSDSSGLYIPLGSFWANTPLLEFKTNYCVLSNDRLCTSQLSELLVLTRCRGNSKGMNQWGRTLTWRLILLQVDWGSYHSIVGVESLVFQVIRTQLKYIQSIICMSRWNYQ